MDPRLLVTYDDLLAARAPQIHLCANHKDYGQAALVGAFTVQQKRAFDRLTSVEMRALAEE